MQRIVPLSVADERVFSVFIASPKDVAEERSIAERAINQLSARLSRLFGVALVPRKWEDFAPISTSRPPQASVTAAIATDSIFVGILWRRYGTRLSEEDVSGTEAEFNHAIEHREAIKILTYFRRQQLDNIPLDQETSEQLLAVSNLKKRLAARHIFHQNYDDASDFAERILLDLTETVLGLLLGPSKEKNRAYVDFFRFSSSNDERIYIVYPPIDVPRSEGKTLGNWQDQLLPSVVYEDEKAIQKIEEAFRLIGKSYRTVTTNFLETFRRRSGDRVWICIPRNHLAKQVLGQIGKKARFSLDYEPYNQRRCLRWRTKKGDEMVIRSPLEVYLKASQRPSSTSNWEPRYGLLIAKDYAVLARFAYNENNGPKHYHYFIGGIRGLGTWGAGCFVDYYPSQLEEIAKRAQQEHEEDIQVLLEITYDNYQIIDVKDVSDESQEYFDEQYRRALGRSESH